DEPWTEYSATGLTAPVGDHNGTPVHVTLGDSPPHLLVGGPTGSGKTNFLYVLIGALAARYGPDELEFYLLDFKEGVSFARFAGGRRDPSWLPHARLVGVNVNKDREFGLALLRFLAEQLRVRAEAARRHEATKLEELRAVDRTGRWPRIVAVIDEFQYLFHQRDRVSAEAVSLLEDLARRGRSQGIHLVLSSQDTSGIQALWGRSAIVAQFTGRVALPRARRVLAEDNPQADLLPRWHAVVNAESGARTGNQIARLPDAGRGGALDALQARLWEHRPAGRPGPRLFDGDVVPTLAGSADFARLTRLSGSGRRSPAALVGQLIDVDGSAATVRLSRTPGRNCAVIGTRVTETCDILVSMALSLARQHEPGEASFDLGCLDEDAAEVAECLQIRLRKDGHEAACHDLDRIRPLLASAAADVEAAITDETGRRIRPRYLVLFAVDMANALLAARNSRTGRSGLDNLRHLVRRGPEVRTHVLGWWRTVARLKEDLGGLGARLDDIGAWVALDVQGAELAPLPGGQLASWSPRRRRALFFDRSVHSGPRPVIPFDTASCLDGDPLDGPPDGSGDGAAR
ncbi:MAG TPA: FtsK/SpoIIIE domain-containing protein, partial [Mycobacteriales bacterium]|nr:FtsK/SpoIIIE domain-containing protein [Mycobacteriales bacterium]